MFCQWWNQSNVTRKLSKKQNKSAQHKSRLQEAFYRCKEKCVCGESKCLSASLKECPQCHDILNLCARNLLVERMEKKPVMIMTAAAVAMKPTKREVYYKDDDESDDYGFDSSSSDDVIDSCHEKGMGIS